MKGLCPKWWQRYFLLPFYTLSGGGCFLSCKRKQRLQAVSGMPFLLTQSLADAANHTMEGTLGGNQDCLCFQLENDTLGPGPPTPGLPFGLALEGSSLTDSVMTHPPGLEGNGFLRSRGEWIT